MKFHRAMTLCLVVFLGMVLTGLAWGASTFEWSRRYDGPMHGTDEPAAVAVNASGSVFVTGTISRAGEKTGYATLKYDADGKLEWVRRSEARATARAKAIALDASGNVVVTGESDGEFLTIKYDDDGNELWTRRYRRGAGYNDGARAITIRSDGVICVAGDSVPAGGASDFLVVEYDPDGEVMRTFFYDGPSGKADEVKAIAVDGRFNVYVTGRSQDESGNYELTAMRFGVTDPKSWLYRYAGKPEGFDEAEAMASGPGGDLYVVGTSAGDNGTDYVVMKIDGEGEAKWVRRYDGASHGDDRARSIALGPMGEVYVTGWSHDAVLGQVLTTLCYDDAGNLRWASRYEGAAGAVDRAAAVAVDAYGKVVVTGSVGPMGDAAAGFVTRKLDTNGRVLWTRRLDAGAGSDSHPVGLALDGSTNVLLAGTSRRSAGSPDYLTVKYGQAPLWETEIVSQYESVAPAMAIDASGNPHLCYVENPEGEEWLLRYAAFDGTRWIKKIVEPYSVNECALAVDSKNHVSIFYSDRVEKALKCVTFDGSERVETLVDSQAGSISAVVDAGDRLHISYVRSATSTLEKSILVYARHDGTEWVKESITEGIGSSPSSYGGTSLALTAEGKVHITATDPGGELYWMNNTSGTWRGSQIAKGFDASLALDGQGYPHVVYYNADEQRIDYARYDGSRWIRTDLFKALGLVEEFASPSPSIHRDDAGVIHAVFSTRRYDDRLVHAYKVKSGWAYDVIAGQEVSHALQGRGDDLYIGFGGERATENDCVVLKFARRRLAR